MSAADVVMLASGTASLEAMLLRRPMVVAWRGLAPTWFILRRWLGRNIRFIALPNLLAGRRIVPEFLQAEVRPERVGPAVLRLLERGLPVETGWEFERIHRELRSGRKSAAAAVLALAGRAEGHGVIAGVDEAGRGPLAGPVVAAAVIFSPGAIPGGLADSKILAPSRRAELAERIRERALGWALGQAAPAEIDRLNILEATFLAMRRALAGLAASGTVPELVLVDGNRCPSGLPFPARAVVRGDASVAEISAASILAKVWRDREMERLGRRWPQYGFGAHKGYPTPAHLERGPPLRPVSGPPVDLRAGSPVPGSGELTAVSRGTGGFVRPKCRLSRGPAVETDVPRALGR